MDLSKFKDIIDIEENGILVKIYWKSDFTKAEKTEKKKCKAFISQQFKGKLIVDFRLSKNLFEPVDVVSVLPEEIEFDKFIQEICNFFQSVRGYSIKILNTEDIIVITSNNFNEDGNPDFKLTLSIYKNKNKFMAQANAPNLNDFQFDL